ncbi:HAMP domain-containing histidine kinase [Candidatus Dojkabacteria bacterium]|nr:HAMP domain-containing histidine kinase [Candidatus Dojkabacteria bacterium]
MINTFTNNLLSLRFKILNTIRFKLTLLYSLITFIFIASLVVVLNVYLNNYLKSEPRRIPPPKLWIDEIYRIPGSPDDFYIKLEERQLKTIREIRLEDLNEIQRASIFSIFPIALLSFILGYILSGRFLKPISNLQYEIMQIQREDLGKTIPVENDDEVGRLITSFNDLSSRLKHAFDTQDSFVQDAQHELKTPLTIIQTNLDTVLDDENASKAELKEAIANSLEAIKLMRDLTNNLLDLTLPAESYKAEVDISEIITNQVDILKSYAQNLNVGLTYPEPKQQILIKANKIALERALFNIIENAIKYCSKVKNPLVEICVEKNKNEILIKIKDNGIGISKENQEKIFERFFRVDKSRSKKTGGFGLGLAIAKKFIEDNSGSIHLESNPGNTEFTILFKTKRKVK